MLLSNYYSDFLISAKYRVIHKNFFLGPTWFRFFDAKNCFLTVL